MRLIPLFLILSAIAYADEMAKVKEIFSQENRRGAIVEIDKLLLKAKNKKEREKLNEKKKLFLNQFFTAQSFQKYQEAKLLLQNERFVDCIRVTDSIAKQDQDNATVLIQKLACAIRGQSWSLADETYRLLLPHEILSNELLIEYSNALIQQKKIEPAKSILDGIKTNEISMIEKTVLAKAQILLVAGKTNEAVEYLKEDQEVYMEHYEVNYLLAQLYQNQISNEWMARKYYSLFLGGCKRKDKASMDLKFEEKCRKASDMILEIDKRLGV